MPLAPRIPYRLPALFLDPGTKTGWALLTSDEGEGAWESGTLEWARDRDGERFAQFRWWLERQHAGEAIQTVAREIHQFETTTVAAHIRGGFDGVLAGWAFARSIPLFGVSVQSVRAAFGAASRRTRPGQRKPNRKLQVMQELDRQGVRYASEDEADALAVMVWARGGGAIPTL